MIEQGTDGLSHGSTDKSVMVGGDMLLHVPLDLTTTECHPPLQNWIREWAPQEPEFLLHSDWDLRLGDPPAAADVAIEEL
eukprot:7393918-Ditylum_brightwellii.AAC.1